MLCRPKISKSPNKDGSLTTACHGAKKAVHRDGVPDPYCPATLEGKMRMSSRLR